MFCFILVINWNSNFSSLRKLYRLDKYIELEEEKNIIYWFGQLCSNKIFAKRTQGRLRIRACHSSYIWRGVAYNEGRSS